MQTNHEYPTHIIMGDNSFSRIKTEEIYKAEAGQPVVEETIFGWIIRDGDQAWPTMSACISEMSVTTK